MKFVYKLLKLRKVNKQSEFSRQECNQVEFEPGSVSPQFLVPPLSWACMGVSGQKTQMICYESLCEETFGRTKELGEARTQKTSQVETIEHSHKALLMSSTARLSHGLSEGWDICTGLINLHSKSVSTAAMKEPIQSGLLFAHLENEEDSH